MHHMFHLWYARWTVYIQWVNGLRYEARANYEIRAIRERFCVTAACYMGDNWLEYTDYSKMQSEIQACRHVNDKKRVFDEIVESLQRMQKVEPQTPKVVSRYTCDTYAPVLSSEVVSFLDAYPVEDAMALLLRYECLSPQGQQWAVPKKWLLSIQRTIGIDLVAFASPMNKQIDAPYCSAYESDKQFGSMGSFLKLPAAFIDKYAGGSFTCEINPPFVEQILLDAVRAIEMFARHICDNKIDVKFTALFVCPDWQDAEYFQRVSNLTTCARVNKYKLRAGEYAYENGTTGKALDTRQDSWLFVITSGLTAEVTLDGFTTVQKAMSAKTNIRKQHNRRFK